MTDPADLDRIARTARAAAPGPPLTPEQYAERLADRARFRRQATYLDRLHDRRRTTTTKEAPDGP